MCNAYVGMFFFYVYYQRNELYFMWVNNIVLLLCLNDHKANINDMYVTNKKEREGVDECIAV